uniref:Myosin IXb n=1 Tax=Sphaeramia orbicularis TaxID=375764 RepID=A0A672ZM52_9TELE
MSATDGAGVPEHDAEVCVVQIYPRPELQRVAYCPLQVSAEDTAKTVIQNTVITLGDGVRWEEKMLNDTDCPLERVLLWPPEAQKWHPRSHGYYFIIQQQVHQGGNQEETSGEDYDDLCDLPSVTEDSILEALSQRFYKFKIYTYASNILIAVNPNKCLPVYYNPKYVKKYENQPLGKESPHIFAIADVAFRTMLNRQANQCIVISGESASGKTESSSYLIHCLTALSQKTYSGGLERTILGAGPVLEAFGNAKTAQNNNSSRFGKFIQLNYLESGVIRGYASKCFLSYHVFYYLLVGASKDDQKYFHLLQPQDYLYLKQVPLIHTLYKYKRLHQAMEMVGFLPSTKKHIFSMLSAILHLGNVTYTQSEDTQVLEVGSAQVLSILCELLKVKQESLIKALTMRRVVTANDTVVSQYTLEEAIRVRDSMAKSLYSALFDWIIFHINHALLNRRDMEESISCLSIGVLDMFGFENLQKNSFEQLCINYTNEKMQYYITQHIFKLQQDDYISEDIDWQIVDYPNNIGCIQLISDKTNGLFDLLDMESSLPEATDQTLLDKLKQHHQDNPVFVHNTDTESTFVIQHFAGTVKYHIKDFRDRNTEHMRPEVVSLLRSSERAFLHCMVTSSPEALFRWGVLRATIRILTIFKNLGRRRAEFSEQLYLVLMKLYFQLQPAPSISLNSFTLDFSFDRSDEHPLEVFEDIFAIVCFIKQNLMDMRSLQHIVGVTVHDRTSKTMFHPHRMIKPPTVSTQFQASLGKLLEKMEKANPFFIFCIRSNAEKKGMHFDDKLVLQQIKHMGLVQTVNIQKLGYSAKYTFKEFVEKFRMLLPKGATATSEHITQLFENMNLDKTTYQIGKTKVFLKEKERRLLQETLNTVVIRHIIILQRWFRVCLIRLHFLYTTHPYQMPNQSSGRASRNPTIRISRATRAMEWNASLDREITNPKELRNLDEFLGNQVSLSSEEGSMKLTVGEVLLCFLLEHRPVFFSLGVGTPSGVTWSSNGKPQIGYKDLMKGYQNKVSTLAGPKQKAEVSLVVNLFQSVLDGFIRGEMKRVESDPLDHLFSTYQVNIMQSCDLCGSYIWGMEKAYMCSACKLICHKKCLSKIITDCSTRCSRQDENLPGTLHFGVQVCVLTSKANPVPKVVELLLMHVELNGLYTEGIYRKSGSACRARELHQILETDPEGACLDNYPMHTITGLVKRWLRELPDPLMTFSLYNDFLHAVEFPERSERIRAVYQKVDELPPANYNTLERLIFHLVRVAKEEEHNKMSPSSLAIVFAPCILRSPDSNDPFLGMKDVSKTTTCVEILITEQFRRYREMMQNIQELEYAEALAVNELKLRRQNTRRPSSRGSSPSSKKSGQRVLISLFSRLSVLLFFREDLACRLPDLEQENSENDNLDSASSMSTESLEDRLGSLDSEGQ